MGKRVVVCLVFIAIFTGLAKQREAVGAVVWDEAVNGDLSGDRLVPSAVVLGAGVNSLSGSIQSGDLDYIAVTVPQGYTFTQFNLTDYDGIDFTSFIAVQAGSTFTAAPPIPPVGSLLGYSHFGPNAPFGARVGDDLMYTLGTAAGAIGFSAPLTSGAYTFWLQQTGSLTEYEFDFVFVPEPATLPIALAGMSFAVSALRRRPRGKLCCG